MGKHSLVRTVYLYLFAVLGLVLLTIGGVRFIDMGLKAFVFTQVEEEQRLYPLKPPMPYLPVDVEALQDEEELTDREKASIRQWLADYEDWQERSSKIDPVTARRQRDASINLALILVGLPLYLYHWGIIRKELRKQGEEGQQ